jgi:hypothetical protein
MARGYRGRRVIGAVIAAGAERGEEAHRLRDLRMMRLALATSVAVVGVAALAPAPAAATDVTLGTENGLTYMVDSAPIAAGAITVATEVQCPVGLKLLGGAADSVSGRIGGLLNSARPVDGGDGNTRADDAYAAWAYNSTDMAGDTVVWAVCGPGGSKVRTESTKLPLTASKSAKAQCPAGTRVVGGGAFVTGDVTFAQLKATRPFDSGDSGDKPDDGWLARATNIGSEPLKVTATALCRSGLAPKYFGALGAALTDTDAGAGASCPTPPNPSTSASAAGGDIRGRGSTVRISGVLLDDNTIEAGTLPDDGVGVQVQNFSAEEAHYGPFGVCMALG